MVTLANEQPVLGQGQNCAVLHGSAFPVLKSCGVPSSPRVGTFGPVQISATQFYCLSLNLGKVRQCTSFPQELKQGIFATDCKQGAKICFLVYFFLQIFYQKHLYLRPG